MLLNAEGLPIEYIDRIQITLNPLLYPFINYEKITIDPKKELRLSYSHKYGIHWYLDIQAQRICQNDIYGSIAGAVFKLIKERFIILPVKDDIMALFVYIHLDYFVSEVRAIEFCFDFEPNSIEITNPEAFINYNGTIYSTDRRVYKGRPSRKSLLKLYDRKKRLKKVNKIPHKTIENNPFSQRIEFLLNKSNCPYRSVTNLKGTYHAVMSRYIPYLAILYYRFFYKNILLNPKDHPYFTQISALAVMGKTRYTGDLEKMTSHKSSEGELHFFRYMLIQKLGIQSTNVLALLALQG